MDGKSESAHGFGTRVKHSIAFDRFSFDTTAGIVCLEYDHNHPIFDRHRRETGQSMMIIGSYGELFGIRPLSLQAVVVGQCIDSNISFFDAKVVTVGLGVKYDF